MSVALEMRNVAKRFTAGTDGCLASCNVLRTIDLELSSRDGIAIVAPRGAGKSTLLLCAAGLMIPDAGEILWFGDRSRSAARDRTRYYCSAADFASEPRGCARGPRVHLVDLATIGDRLGVLAPWLLRRRDDGGAIVVAAEDERIADALGLRAIALRFGQLVAPVASSVHARVAEHAPFC